MDPYVTVLALGAVGLVTMAFSGFGRHGRLGAGHGHAHVGGAHAGAHGAAHAGHGGHAVSHASAHGQHAPGTAGGGAARSFLSLTSPRVLFSICLGLGTSGLLLRPLLGGGILLAVAALAGGVIFERVLVTPIWNFSLRFASEPAATLESAIDSEATAVTTFDADGNGLVAVEVDGQLVQLLGTLQSTDRELRARVTAGAKLRIEAVDAERHRCTVSLV